MKNAVRQWTATSPDECGRTAWKFILTALAATTLAPRASALSLDDLQVWAGTGTNRAAIVVHWSAPEFRNNSTVESPIANVSLAWGFRWNGTADAEDLLNALATTDERLVPVASPPSMFGLSVLGLVFDLNGNGIVGLKNGTNVLLRNPTNGFITLNYGAADVHQSLDAGDVFWAGWNGPTWELWTGFNTASNGTNSPERGLNRYWTPRDPNAPYSGSHGEWRLAGAGMGGITLSNGLWIGFSVAAGGFDFMNPEAPGTVAYGQHKRAPKHPAAAPAPLRPYATAIIAAQGPFGSAPYDDPNAVLGMPATDFYDPFGVFSGGDNARFVKLIEPAFNTGTNQTTKLITTLSSGDSNSAVIVEFAQPIHDDAAHPYGIDFLVFGNSFYTANGATHDEANMNTLRISDGFVEPLKVSVSPGFAGLPGEVAHEPATWRWYQFTKGPFADTAFPTHAYKWNRAHTNWSAERMDFTKPVNPALANLMTSGITAADGIELYAGSGGGTGFDLRETGFASVRYVKVEGIGFEFSEGEVDALALVRPATLNDELLLTPANLTNGTSTLQFQEPGRPSQLAAAITFTSLSNLARVRASAVNNPDERAGLPAGVLSAVRFDVGPALGTGAVRFAANLAIAATGYLGNGQDLHLFQGAGTNWVEKALSFAPSNSTVLVNGLTNAATFAVVQKPVVPLQIVQTTNRFYIAFEVVPGWIHTLELTTNFVDWVSYRQFFETNSGNGVGLLFQSKTPPGQSQFYRVRLELP